jgi:hypothetical protein
MSLFFSLPMIFPASSPGRYAGSIPYFDVIAFFGSSIVVVVVYFLLRFQSYLQKDTVLKIQSNSIERLSRSLSAKDPISKKLDRLREDKGVLAIFHSILESDESMKEKAKSMYWYEFIWNVLADLIGISAIASAGYFIYSWINTNPIIILFGILSIGICIAARYGLFPKASSQYVERSNEQFEQVIQLKMDEFRESVLRLF